MHDGSGQVIVDFTAVGRPRRVHVARGSEKVREAGLSQELKTHGEEEKD
jgi:hypothetical protein